MESLVGGFAGGDGDRGGGCAHRNRCLRVKAAFGGSVKFPANEAFATRAAIPAAVVWLWGSGGSGGGGRGGVGGDARRSRRWLLVLCGDGSDSEKLLPAKTAS